MVKEHVQTAYMDDSAFEYDEIRFVSPQGKLFNTLECNELERCLRSLHKSSSIAEIGCGTGRFLPLATHYCGNVTGIDPSPDMLKVAQGKVTNTESVCLLEGEGAAIPLGDNSVDFVYSIRTLNQVGTQDYAYRMVKELFRICKPGGHVLMEIVNRKSLNRAKADVRFTVNEVGQFLKSEKLGTVLRNSGILFFSQTVLDKTPAFFVPVFRVVDQAFAKLFPKYCTRCYILARKPE